jgi:hypothetical protein
MPGVCRNRIEEHELSKAEDDVNSPEAKARNHRRYMSEARRMQSGVAAAMHRSAECHPKHLRVGVNSAMVETSALVALLIAKGIITEGEWLRAIADGMETERKSYERMLGPGVTLGEAGSLNEEPVPSNRERH